MSKIPVDDPMNEVIRKMAQDSQDGSKYDMRTVLVGGSAAAGGQSGPVKIKAIALNSSTSVDITQALLDDGLSGYNALQIQNFSAIDIEISYDSAWTYLTGDSWTIRAGSEWYRDITNAVHVYAKSASGTPTIKVEGIGNA